MTPSPFPWRSSSCGWGNCRSCGCPPWGSTTGGTSSRKRASRRPPKLFGRPTMPGLFFCKSQQSDAHIRSEDCPEGWVHPMAKEGQQHLEKVEKLCAIAGESNTQVSIEHPRFVSLELHKDGQADSQDEPRGHHLKPVCVWWFVCRTHAHPHECGVDAVGLPYLQRGESASSLRAGGPDEVEVFRGERPPGLCLVWARALKNFLDSEEGMRWKQRNTYVKVGRFGNVLVRQDTLRREPVDGSTHARSFSEPSSSLRTEPTKREVREAENNNSVGGLRDARRSVARSTDLRQTGRRLSCCLELGLASDVLNAFEQCPQANPFSADVVLRVQQALATEFGTCSVGQGYENGLLSAILLASADADARVIPNWLDEGFPAFAGPSLTQMCFPALPKFRIHQAFCSNGAGCEGLGCRELRFVLRSLQWLAS